MTLSDDGTDAVTPVRGRTHWIRFFAVVGPALLAVGVMAGGMAQGALAAAVAVSGNTFTINADAIDGGQLTGYPTTVTDGQGASKEVLLLAFRSATLKNLCLRAGADLPGIGPVTVRLKSGAGGTVQATNFVADAQGVIGGGASLDNLEVGLDASALTRGQPGPQGRFGLQSSQVQITNFEATAQAATGGSFRLSGIDLSISRGKGTCA